jgi:hypothetical protein
MGTMKTQRFFLCTGQAVTEEQLREYPHSHIIGELRYVLDEGKKITALARWDVSVSTLLAIPERPDVDVYFIGDAREIKCRYPGCRNRERWEIGQAAFMRLMARYGRLNV